MTVISSICPPPDHVPRNSFSRGIRQDPIGSHRLTPPKCVLTHQLIANNLYSVEAIPLHFLRLLTSAWHHHRRAERQRHPCKCHAPIDVHAFSSSRSKLRSSEPRWDSAIDLRIGFPPLFHSATSPRRGGSPGRNVRYAASPRKGTNFAAFRSVARSPSATPRRFRSSSTNQP